MACKRRQCNQRGAANYLSLSQTNFLFAFCRLVGINGAEGNFKSFLEALEGENIIDEYTTLVSASSIPNWLRWILRKVLDKRRAHLLGSSRKLPRHSQ